MSGLRFPRPEPDERFRKRLRADLMNEAVALAEERLRRPSVAERLGVFVLRLRPYLVAAVVMAAVVGGAGVAAAGSLPGDAAYPLKQAADAIELALAPDADAKVKVLTAQAQRRLDELQRAAADRPDKAPTASEEYAEAVERLREAVEAVRTAEPEDKREAVEELVEDARVLHVEVLEQLRERVPEQAQPGIDRALEEQQRIGAGRPATPGKPSQPGRPSAVPSAGAPARTGGDRTPTPTPSPTPTPTSTSTPTVTPRAATETPRGGRPSSVPPARP